jgi:hypothetical protein
LPTIYFLYFYQDAISLPVTYKIILFHLEWLLITAPIIHNNPISKTFYLETLIY